jgi:stringent starvation protein B
MSDDASQLNSLRPYLLRAHHEWMSDNGLTPHLVVNAERPGVAVPFEFIKDGSIVLNISLRAVRDLALDNDAISFNARFSGVSQQIYVPISAVRGLVAREYGVGLTFPEEAMDDEHPDVTEHGRALSAVDDSESGDDEPPHPPQPGKRPSLRVVK